MTEAVQLAVGERIPAFSTLDQDGNPFSSDALIGRKTILYFFPAALTLGCAREAADFMEAQPIFEAAGYQVIGVSPDSVEKLKRFQERDALTFPLLSDEDISIHKAFGAFGEKALYGRLYKGVLRSTVVVAEDGTIEHAFFRVKATGHVDDLLEAMGLAAR